MSDILTLARAVAEELREYKAEKVSHKAACRFFREYTTDYGNTDIGFLPKVQNARNTNGDNENSVEMSTAEF